MFSMGILSSISLPFENSPSSSNSLHTIYLVSLFVFVYCIDFLYQCIDLLSFFLVVYLFVSIVEYEVCSSI